MLRLHTEFQCPTMPGTGLKVCGGMVGGMVGGWCKPILVFSLGQAEQYLCKLISLIFIKNYSSENQFCSKEAA